MQEDEDFLSALDRMVNENITESKNIIRDKNRSIELMMKNPVHFQVVGLNFYVYIDFNPLLYYNLDFVNEQVLRSDRRVESVTSPQPFKET